MDYALGVRQEEGAFPDPGIDLRFYYSARLVRPIDPNFSLPIESSPVNQTRKNTTIDHSSLARGIRLSGIYNGCQRLLRPVRSYQGDLPAQPSLSGT